MNIVIVAYKTKKRKINERDARILILNFANTDNLEQTHGSKLFITSSIPINTNKINL